MNATDTLITPQETVKFGPVDSHSSSLPSCNFIILKEEKLFRECLGWSFYQALMADKIDYNSYTSFRSGTSYALGDIVLQDDVLYECIQATTGTQAPSDKLYWKVAPKFSTAANQYLWDRYLRYLLAFTVNYTSLLNRAISDTDQGLIRKKSDNFEPAKLSDVFLLKKEYEGDIRDIFNNMDLYIMDNTSSYPEYSKIKLAASCSKDNGCKIAKPDYYGFNL